MTYPIDALYFNELARRDPRAVCRRSGCSYDATQRVYTLAAWGDRYAVNPQEHRIDCINLQGPEAHEFFHLFLIYYLLHAREIDPQGEWISEKDIPGGTTFFRGPHEVPTQLISRRYRNDVETLRKKCGRLHGQPLRMADAAWRFEITPRIAVAVLYWVGDDDFPPEAKLLYDRTITEHLTADIVFALAVSVCDRIAKAFR